MGAQKNQTLLSVKKQETLLMEERKEGSEEGDEMKQKVFLYTRHNVIEL